MFSAHGSVCSTWSKPTMLEREMWNQVGLNKSELTGNCSECRFQLWIFSSSCSCLCLCLCLFCWSCCGGCCSFECYFDNAECWFRGSLYPPLPLEVLVLKVLMVLKQSQSNSFLNYALINVIKIEAHFWHVWKKRQLWFFSLNSEFIFHNSCNFEKKTLNWDIKTYLQEKNYIKIV